MKEGVKNFDLNIVNVPRQYGIINLQLIFAQSILENKIYSGNIDDVVEILSYISVSEINA